jgi:ABC-2 type transport system ATP-binding protein
MLPQSFGYYRGYTVREFVEYLAWLKAVPGRDISAEVQRAIDRVGLAPQADTRLRKLSGGMVRRVGLAQAIVGDPALLVLDEPTTGLDPQSRAKVRELLWGLGASSCVVVATHLIEDVAEESTEIMIMDDGLVAFRGTSAEIKAAAGKPASDSKLSELERGYAALLEGSRRATR